MARAAGFTMKATLVLAPPASEPDAGLNVSHGCVLDADQLRAVLVAPVFCTARDCDEVAALPWAAEKLNVVEVVTERTAWFATVTAIEVEVAVLLLLSVAKA
jgi:hypothetical protein